MIAERRAEIHVAVNKWLLFWADFGARRLYLEDFPLPLSDADKEDVFEYLEKIEVKVQRPRWGRPAIILEQ